VHAYPIKPTLNVPGTNLLTLTCDEPLSTVAFKFNLRRYKKAELAAQRAVEVEATRRNAEEARKASVRAGLDAEAEQRRKAVGPGMHCPPRRPTHLEISAEGIVQPVSGLEAKAPVCSPHFCSVVCHGVACHGIL